MKYTVINARVCVCVHVQDCGSLTVSVGNLNVSDERGCVYKDEGYSVM